MKKLTIFLVMLALAGVLFAEGSITSTTAYNVDAAEVVETIDTSVVFGPLTVGNKLVLTMLEGTVWDWTGKFNYAVGPMTLAIETGYGTDTVLPFSFKAGYVVGDSFSVSGKYALGDVMAEEFGTVTVEGKLTF